MVGLHRPSRKGVAYPVMGWRGPVIYVYPGSSSGGTGLLWGYGCRKGVPLSEEEVCMCLGRSGCWHRRYCSGGGVGNGEEVCLGHA